MNRLPLRKGRRSELSKAIRNNLKIVESDRWVDFWQILEANLRSRHGLRPVHTVEEIQRLHYSFPEHIRLFCVLDGQLVVAGTVVFETPQVAHTQYLGCNDSGRRTGALDLLLDHLLQRVFSTKPYFNFGVSTTNDGRMLNKGLVDFKESFGARSVVQDCYHLDLSSADFLALDAGHC